MQVLALFKVNFIHISGDGLFFVNGLNWFGFVYMWEMTVFVCYFIHRLELVPKIPGTFDLLQQSKKPNGGFSS